MTAQGNSPVEGQQIPPGKPGPPPRRAATPLAAPRASEWGRVEDDGTVYVRTADGERTVGQYPEGTPEEALAFFTRRFDALEFEVQLLEQRVRAGTLSPDEATESIKRVSSQVTDANAVGDLVGLSARLDALGPLVAVQRTKRREDRARKLDESRARKEQIVGEAEKISLGKDWRNGVNRLRDLLEEWKLLPRLDKKSDDELWHRFSGARTAYTRRRKAHFSELSEVREGARVTKERLLKEAESLSDSTDWGPTSTRYRSLMQEWKSAGAAPRDVEEDLWQRFRAAQDAFFGARDAANAEQDKEFAANAEKKRELLVEAEALLPVRDLESAKRIFRDISERWDAAGKVPRDDIKPLEARIRKVEQAIRSVEDDQWKRSDPEKSARADDMLGQLERAIAGIEADLEEARAAGNDTRIKELEENLASRQSFLEMARKAATEFS
ncbi:MAG: hypothetical protein JWP24_561 [Marmoricola sp.]|nr:hypothetical protein [Marmoricola sp.]